MTEASPESSSGFRTPSFVKPPASTGSAKSATAVREALRRSGSTREGGDAKIFSREGLFEASQASQASQANVYGLFCNFEASQRAHWDASKSEFGSMITRLGTLGRLRFFGSF